MYILAIERITSPAIALNLHLCLNDIISCGSIAIICFLSVISSLIIFHHIIGADMSVGRYCTHVMKLFHVVLSVIRCKLIFISCNQTENNINMFSISRMAHLEHGLRFDYFKF